MNDYSPPYDTGRCPRVLFWLGAALILIGAAILCLVNAAPPSPCAIYSTTESRS